jgi:hypothetical protein
MTWTNTGGSAVITPVTINPAALSIPFLGTVIAVDHADVSAFSSYDLTMYAYDMTGASVVVQCDLVWYDDLVSTQPVYQETWWPPVGDQAAPVTAHNDLVAGSGPMHGRYLSVILINYGGNTLTFKNFNVFGSNRVLPKSDWRSQPFHQVASGLTYHSSAPLTNGAGTGYDNFLCNIIVTITPGQLLWVPMPLYAGPVYWMMNIQGAVLAQDPVMGSLAYDSPPVSGGTGGVSGGLLVDTTPAIGSKSGQIILPRAPCYWTLAGNASSNATVQLSVVAQQ